MKFREACAEAVIKSKEHGVVFYVHEAPSMWEITPTYKNGWLFKVYPGGRKIFATAADKFLQSETRPTPHAPDAGDAPRFWDVATKPDITFVGDVPLKSPRR